LEQVSQEVTDPGLAKVIRDLDQALYSKRSTADGWNGKELWDSISSFRPQTNAKPDEHSTLQPLYP
ncbi:MAG: hypothetical protein ACR2QW_14020, partial [bacterium]